MKIVYRKSIKRDLPQILELLKVFNSNVPNIVADGFCVAADGGRVLGCARIIELSDGNVELASVVVAEDRRKMGIGGKLIQTLLSRENRRPVYLMCRRTNQRFYEELGFREIKDDLLPPIYKNKVKSKRDEVKVDGLAMIKEL